MAKVLKGKEVVDALNEELRGEIEKMSAKGVYPTLGILRVGEKPDDMAYERGAMKRAEKVGVAVKNYIFPEDISEEELLGKVEEINNDSSVHGVLILRPLPKTINDEKIRNALAPEKDIDGITDKSSVGVYSGTDIGYPPCTAEACIEILKHFGVETRGSNAVVIGRSLVIGKPVAMMLIKGNATVTTCHTKTVDMPSVCRDADILIAAAGQKQMVTKEYMNPEQVIIDVGINVGDDGKLCGDVVSEDAEACAKAYTPVPGGVGTVTTSLLMKHTVEAAKKTI